MYKLIQTLEQLQSYIADSKLVAFDFETAPNELYRTETKASLDPHQSHIVGISFSVAEGDGVYLPLTHRVGENAESPEKIWDWLGDFFSSPEVTKIAHNLAFESAFLYARGIIVQEPCYDTIAAFSTTARTDSELQQYKTEGSYILQFAEECLTVDPAAETLRIDIWNAFVEYCSDNGINRDKISKHMVNKELEEHFSLKRSRIGVARQHTYVGIRLEN